MKKYDVKISSNGDYVLTKNKYGKYENQLDAMKFAYSENFIKNVNEIKYAIKIKTLKDNQERYFIEMRDGKVSTTRWNTRPDTCLWNVYRTNLEEAEKIKEVLLNYYEEGCVSINVEKVNYFKEIQNIDIINIKQYDVFNKILVRAYFNATRGI